QRLAESLSTMNQSDSHELLGYLFSLLQSGSSDASLPTESLGKFSIMFEPGIPVTPSGFKLELIVEPLHGKTFTVYPEVFASDTIEKLKLDVS
uniref:Uncharacterized protein n=1 Tax=Amphimedon queenslandica TaxID=400682 RepID=A0A1X7SN86_AMPQE